MMTIKALSLLTSGIVVLSNGKWEESGKVIAGGRGQGNRLDQLYCQIDVIIEKETNSVLIANLENRRVL